MRSFGKVSTLIWRDTDFTNLAPHVQRVYLMLISQPDVSLCGVLSYAPKRWSSFAGSTTPRQITDACRTLEDERYVLIDDATEEIVIRSFVKHDVPVSNVKLATAAKSQFGEIHSHQLRGALSRWYPELFGGLENPLETDPWDRPSDRLSDRPSHVLYPRGQGPDDRGQSTEDNHQSSKTTMSTKTPTARIWETFQTYKPKSRLTPDRKRRIEKWLAIYDEATLTSAIHGNHLDPHCNGQNDRGTEYHDLELILRDAGHIERYAAIHQATTRNGKPTEEEMDELIRRVDKQRGYA